jgi:hypothetical protein
VVNPTILLSILLIVAGIVAYVHLHVESSSDSRGIVAYVRLQRMWDISIVEFIDGAATTRCRDRLRPKLWITMLIKTKLMKRNSVHLGLVNTMVARESSCD